MAAGTAITPAPFTGGAASLLWSPVASLAPSGPRFEAGVTSIHAPEEIGVNGGAVALSARVKGSVVSVVWGRLGIDGIERTETSPESVDGEVPVDAQVFAVGLTRQVRAWLTAGAALRLATGTLGDVTRTQAGLDIGAVAAWPHLRLGAGTRAFDPAGAPGDAASYLVAGEISSATFAAMGMSGTARVRYGSTIQQGEGMATLMTAGVALGAALAVDVGAARETVAGETVWRSRLGVTAGTERYRVEFGRDGGVNGFGATYAFGLVAGLK